MLRLSPFELLCLGNITSEIAKERYLKNIALFRDFTKGTKVTNPCNQGNYPQIKPNITTVNPIANKSRTDNDTKRTTNFSQFQNVHKYPFD
jgi:hypothetical protein